MNNWDRDSVSQDKETQNTYHSFLHHFLQLRASHLRLLRREGRHRKKVVNKHCHGNFPVWDVPSSLQTPHDLPRWKVPTTWKEWRGATHKQWHVFCLTDGSFHHGYNMFICDDFLEEGEKAHLCHEICHLDNIHLCGIATRPLWKISRS